MPDILIPVLGVSIYCIVKLFFYTVWCYYYNRQFQLLISKKWLIIYAAIRVVIGIILGFFISILLNALAIYFEATKDITLFCAFGGGCLKSYILIFIPMRWFEWGLMEVIMNPAKRNISTFLFAMESKSVKVRIVGIALSFVADFFGFVAGFATLLTFGGRIFC